MSGTIYSVTQCNNLDHFNLSSTIVRTSNIVKSQYTHGNLVIVVA